MISRENYNEAHIRQLQNESRRDPVLIERALFAFGLLEALVNVGLKFTFKGGTSLMLLLSKPMRLSTDIDIVVDPGTDIDEYIRKASVIFPFKSGGEQERKQRGKIEKRHFKFVYDSPINAGDTLYILLDVLFEENHYEKLIQKEICNDLLITEGENLLVTMPSLDCVLGDKLTAFAPHTTGIPLGTGKDMEVIKQFYDVCTLIDEISDFDCVIKTYNAIAAAEISYRELTITVRDVLQDTIRAAVCICSRGKSDADDFPHYLKGTRDVQQHIFTPGFSMELAVRMAPKVLCMAACLLTETPFERIDHPDQYKQEKLTQKDLILLKTIRKADPTGYGYVVIADRLLAEYRMS